MTRPTKFAWAFFVTIIVGIGVAVLVDQDTSTPAPSDTAAVSDLCLLYTSDAADE